MIQFDVYLSSSLDNVERNKLAGELCLFLSSKNIGFNGLSVMELNDEQHRKEDKKPSEKSRTLPW